MKCASAQDHADHRFRASSRHNGRTVTVGGRTIRRTTGRLPRIHVGDKRIDASAVAADRFKQPDRVNQPPPVRPTLHAISGRKPALT
jgi:hypothetical protein